MQRKRREILFNIIAFAACFLLAMGVATSEAASSADPRCQNPMRENITKQVERLGAYRQEIRNSTFTPGPSLSQVANSPCASKELQRVSNQFAFSATRFAQSPVAQLKSAAGPVSGLMNKMFKAEFKSINDATSLIPLAKNFQTLASDALGGLLSSLGLGDAFSSELCGLMVDMVVKYIQCENPIKIPSLGNLFGSLNDLLPKGCAGAALRGAIFSAGRMRSLNVLNQPINVSPSGGYTPGNADVLNNKMYNQLTAEERATVNKALDQSITGITIK